MATVLVFVAASIAAAAGMSIVTGPSAVGVTRTV